MRITFSGPVVSTFVSNDIVILKRHFEVDVIDAKIGKGAEAIINLLKLHARIILSLIKSDALFFWFADYYTLLPTLVAKLLGKPVFVVAGGFDITYLPELGIGARAKPARWFAVKHTFRYATHIFPVSLDTQRDLDEAVPDHVPSTMIYNAVQTSLYRYRGDLRQRGILTVSQADTLPEFKRKGLDVFIQIAARHQELSFRLVGLRGAMADHARSISEHLPNLEVIPGRVPLDDLLLEFWRAKLYLQPSVEERFGVSVAEAMSCGCLPIVAPVNALLEVVGDAGIVVQREDLDGWSQAIHNNLEAPESSHLRASQQAAQFDIEERAKRLLSVIEPVLQQS